MLRVEVNRVAFFATIIQLPFCRVDTLLVNCVDLSCFNRVTLSCMMRPNAKSKAWQSLLPCSET